MINLVKPDEASSIDLTKSGNEITVKAQWVDNGDGIDDNDDLDLRASILLPNGNVYIVDGSHQCGLDKPPYCYHHGDVKQATEEVPGEEVITVCPDIAIKAGGPVGLVFSVYSAVGNGVVSVASLKPKMVMKFGDQTVQCAYDFSKKLKKSGYDNFDEGDDFAVYTYVIGYAIVAGDQIVVAASGRKSEPGSESTPWPFWKGEEFEFTMDGPSVFKDSPSYGIGDKKFING